MIDVVDDKKPRALLIGVSGRREKTEFDIAMDELSALAEACDLEVAGVLTQNIQYFSEKTYVGSGKAEEIRDAIEAENADIVLCLDALSPVQVRELERIFDTEVLDRTGLILQIFAKRARTREAVLQVESAQLKYMLPFLAGMRKNLSRQGGGSGRLSNKGSGEKQIELDRRHIERRIAYLRRELEAVETERAVQRQRRKKTGMPHIALAGYTNAGKSTLMNALLTRYGVMGKDETAEKKVFEKDMLFATLDTSVRRIEPEGHRPFLLSDTVGFVGNLPTQLVNAFRSTLAEVREADLILLVVDSSDPAFEQEVTVAEETLREIGAGEIPVLYVMNKIDLPMKEDAGQRERSSQSAEGWVNLPESTRQKQNHCFKENPQKSPEKSQIVQSSESNDTGGFRTSVRLRKEHVAYISAKTGEGIETMLTMAEEILAEDLADCALVIPYAEAGIAHEIETRGQVLACEYAEDGIHLNCRLRKADTIRYLGYAFAGLLES